MGAVCLISKVRGARQSNYRSEGEVCRVWRRWQARFLPMGDGGGTPTSKRKKITCARGVSMPFISSMLLPRPIIPVVVDWSQYWEEIRFLLFMRLPVWCLLRNHE